MFWQFLSRNLVLLMLAGAVAAYFYPLLFLLFKDYFLWCFAAATIAIEQGMSAALALEHFEPITALPGALVAVWCILTAAGMTRYLHKKQPANPAI